MDYNLFYKKNLSFAAASSQKNTKVYDNKPRETLTQIILRISRTP